MVTHFRNLGKSNIEYILGWVGTARQQGSCQSCAAFATAAAAEICLAKAGAKLSSLDISEQWLLDCAYKPPNISGCKGAGPDGYGNWLAKNAKTGVVHENSYPYVQKRVK